MAQYLVSAKLDGGGRILQLDLALSSGSGCEFTKAPGGSGSHAFGAHLQAGHLLALLLQDGDHIPGRAADQAER
jgi:hypothetical protein